MNKIENISNRVEWFKSVLKDKIWNKEVEIINMKSARAFCKVALKGCFDSISYNTVKDYLVRTPLDEFGVHVYADNFKYFLEMRKLVYEMAVRQSEGMEGNLENKSTDWKRMYRNALWQSNLCSNAYLSLRRDVQAVLNSDRESVRLDYRKIEKVISRSTSTYLKIISQVPNSVSPDLKLVEEPKK